MTDYTRQQLDDAFESFKETVLDILSDSHEKGMRWQADFAAMAASRGLHVESGQGRVDLVVAGLNVQCKHIDQVSTGGIVCIENMRPVRSNDGERGYLVGEYDVMALKHRGQVYIIPATILSDGRKMVGRLAISTVALWVDAWDVFDESFVPPPPRQPSLPFSSCEVI